MAITDSLVLEYEDLNPKRPNRKLLKRDFLGRRMRKQYVRTEARKQIRQALENLSDPTLLDRIERGE